ncbi:MAG: glycosyltransferase family 2 protein [Gemmatimonadota bacterium]
MIQEPLHRTRATDRSPAGSAVWADVVALIPALDEENALPGVIRGLRAEGVSRVLVVDNGSTDRTEQVARAEGAVVVREEERGYGAACLEGLREIDRRGWTPEVILFLDGDGSDDPGALSSLVAPVLAGSADLVIGIRGEAGRPSQEVPPHARLGNALVLGGARVLHGMWATDLGPFRAVRSEALRRLEMDDRNWGWTLQMQLRAHHAGLKVREVDVPHRPRQGGRSKVSGSLTGSLRAGSKMLLTLLTELPQLRRLRSRRADGDSA